LQGGVVDSGFVRDKELGLGLMGRFVIKGQIGDRLFNAWRAWRPWREPLSGRGIDSR